MEILILIGLILIGAASKGMTAYFRRKFIDQKYDKDLLPCPKCGNNNPRFKSEETIFPPYSGTPPIYFEMVYCTECGYQISPVVNAVSTWNQESNKTWSVDPFQYINDASSPAEKEQRLGQLKDYMESDRRLPFKLYIQSRKKHIEPTS